MRTGSARTRALLITSVVVLALGATPVAPVAAHHLDGPCSLHRGSDETVRHFSARQIRCAVQTLGPVPGGADRAICIADRESGLLPDTQSLTGMYLGLYQHAAEDWDRRYDTYTKPAWDLPTSALKGRTNAVVAIRMVAAAGSWPDAGWPRGGC